MNKIEVSERIAEMFRHSRIRTKKSQDYVASKMGVSKKTIQNWENGYSSPNLLSTFEWFDAIGTPMYPYLMSILHPLEIKDITPSTDEHKLRKALSTYINEMPEHTMRELLFLYFGKHGSCPSGVMEIVTAYLHLPLAMRISIAQQVATSYELCEMTNTLVESDNVSPDWQAINVYAENAKESVKQGKSSYVSYRD